MIAVVVVGVAGCTPRQRVDPTFRPAIAAPTYPAGHGPVVWVDEAHHNITSARPGSRYAPFVATLRADGYDVRRLNVPFSDAALDSVRLLVIGNALHVRNVKDWSLPTPSAFTPEEVRSLYRWVLDGGSLLFLFDHMPYAGAAADLGAAFGLEILNGLVEDPQTWDPARFDRATGTLADHPITRGLAFDSDAVATFDGAAFKAPGAEPLLIISSGYVSYQTAVAWKIDPQTPQIPVAGWLQGAVLRIGRGRVAVFGDATMFSAQLTADGKSMGLNAPAAAGNLQLLRSTLRWLTQRNPTTRQRGHPTRAWS